MSKVNSGKVPGEVAVGPHWPALRASRFCLGAPGFAGAAAEPSCPFLPWLLPSRCSASRCRGPLLPSSPGPSTSGGAEAGRGSKTVMSVAAASARVSKVSTGLATPGVATGEADRGAKPSWGAPLVD